MPLYREFAEEDQEIENWFSYHKPDDDQAGRYHAIRESAKTLAYVIRACTPPGADQTAAMRKLREATMTANAAIACGEKPVE